MATVELNREVLYQKIGYKPHEKQMLFHESLARFKVPVCGRRFGKSKMAAAELLPEMFLPDKRFWIVGPTYELGEKEFRYLWEFIVITLGFGPKLKRKAYNQRTGEMYIEMPWGTRVDVKSADHPDGLVGEGLDGLIVSEAAKQKKQVWEKYLRPSLADKHGWAIFPSTPEGFNWYYDLYKQGQDWSETYSPEYESWNFPSWENPYVYPKGFEDSEVQGQMRSKDDPWFWQEIGASFKSFVGKIYTEWDDSVHIIRENYEYNPAWPNYIFYDPGFANPFCALDVQVAPDDTCYIWREYYEAERSNYRNIQELKMRANPAGYRIDCAFGDAADPGTVELFGTTLCPAFADPDSKDVLRGIQEVKRFMKRDDQGQPHLKVHKSCMNTIFEFQNYRMKQNVRDDGNSSEDPRKYADHAMDAFRYGIMHLYVLGARYHLDDIYKPQQESRDEIEEPYNPFFDEPGEKTFFDLDPVAMFTMGRREVW